MCQNLTTGSFKNLLETHFLKIKHNKMRRHIDQFYACPEHYACPAFVAVS